KYRTRFEQVEGQHEIDVRADEQVGRGEMVCGDIFLAGQRLFERVNGEIVIAVAEHALLLGTRLPARRLVAERGFDRARGEEDPAVIVGALVRRRGEVRLRKSVG